MKEEKVYDEGYKAELSQEERINIKINYQG